MAMKKTDPQRLVEAVASWLQYEQLCYRTELFGESYLTYPVGQFLQSRSPRGLRAEFPHPVLNPSAGGPGDKKRIDYVVLRDNGTVDFAVETKWKSKSNSLITSIIQDFVRLALLASRHEATAILLFGGVRRGIESLFQTKAFLAHPEQPNSKSLLPVHESDVGGVIHLKATSKYRVPVFRKGLERFKDIEVPVSIRISRLGPFPRGGRKNQIAVFGFRIHGQSTEMFTPSQHYKYPPKDTRVK